MNKQNASKKQHVVIVGAGFAGLWAAQRLAKRDAAKLVEVTLIDRNNYHTFPPLLYQVAAAELEAESISYPIRGIFRNTPNVNTLMTEAKGVDIRNRLLLTDGTPIPYDHLVLAPGSRTSYFNIPGAEENTFGLKSIEEAVRLRSHILACFERAAMEGTERHEGLLTVAVVGAGATGLEYAGALAELMSGPLVRDFPHLAKNKAKVVLIDAAPDVLMPFPPRLREYARERLGKMGVEVRTNAQVAEVKPDSIVLKDGTMVRAYTIVWSAGVMGHGIGQAGGFILGRGGRIAVTPTLQIVDRPEIHVAGDTGLPSLENPPPMVAPNAIQQGEHVAKNIIRIVKGKAPEEFVYRDKGSMVTIGRSSAVAAIGKREFTGIMAWMLWLFVHLSYLIGFRNRILVMIGWAWDYFFYERSVRLILPNTGSVLKVCGTGENVCGLDDADAAPQPENVPPQG
ncbi:Pyridine nucleotide-disulfide oxidoreductase family protein [uncultured delta proteobacterium]|uniref:NADH:ubiquinone reductase (non-electrogenic) n=1 Tax=uncultured delta proteobacterium TaxID=34034 RepID=A0A212K3H4_9DELT|nr:Pyridine nucleotide-disulfide oxidoreductase family protein [uncultured delta proteobacterium]